jgi:hypothetical protein
MDTQEETKQNKSYRETRRRYYDLHRDEIVSRCSEITKNRYKNDPEYREQVKLKAKARYMAKKNKVEDTEKREQLKTKLLEIDELNKSFKDKIQEITEEHKLKIEELKKGIETLRSCL